MAGNYRRGACLHGDDCTAMLGNTLSRWPTIIFQAHVSLIPLHSLLRFDNYECLRLSKRWKRIYDKAAELWSISLCINTNFSNDTKQTIKGKCIAEDEIYYKQLI